MCWKPDSLWCAAQSSDMPFPWLSGEHCALCWWGRQANGSRFQQKQEVRIGGFLLPGLLFPPTATWTQTKTMCALTLLISSYSRPGCPAGRRDGLPNNIWFQETFTPSLLPLLFESPFCAALLVLLGEAVSDSSLCQASRDAALPSEAFSQG